LSKELKILILYFRLATLIFLFSLGIGNLAKADPVDEAAKCSAAFRVLTSLETQNKPLGQHFTQLAMFSSDLIGLYSQIYRGSSMTNGETSELTTDFQLMLDAASNDGSAFLPYVKSCTGWLVNVSTATNNADRDGADIREVLASAPKPSLSFQYPHANWPAMQEMFGVAYEIWTDMGKITPRDLRKALED